MRKLLLILLLIAPAVASLPERALAQHTIAYLTPDVGAPGMCIAVEFIAPVGQMGSFGGDGAYSPYGPVHAVFVNPADSQRVRFGPSVVSWSGRMLQQMVMIEPNAAFGWVPIRIAIAGNLTNIDSIEIIPPVHVGALSGGGTIGSGTFGPRSPRNVIVVDSLILTNGTWTPSTVDPDLRAAGNQAFLPLRILSMGPIRLNNATINVNGGNGTTGAGGGVGGPGGGGGGGGFLGSGGDGFTGGGAMADQSSPGTYHGGVGTGSISGSSYYHGGQSLNGVPGGIGREHHGVSDDEGGGAGTGHPFGTSGAEGQYNADSRPGGYGAGSGGGSASGGPSYGGGGGGYYGIGSAGHGGANNGGQQVGNNHLLPFAGGSGGASGNVAHFATGQGGSGGAGGGALELTSFASLMIPSGGITAKGGSGSSGTSGSFNLENGAGGGGGSGGAVQISARDSISIGTASYAPAFDISGGNGGGGNPNAGGSGGVGHVRLNGYVSKVNGNLAFVGYYDQTRDYVGPSIQKVNFTKNSFTVTGYGGSWEGFPPSPVTLKLYYYSNSLGWQSTTVSTLFSAASHSAKFVSGGIPLPNGATDTELYIVVEQPDQFPTSGTFVDVPAATMSHTSGIIAKVPGIPLALVKTNVIDFGKVRVGNCSRDTTVKLYSVGHAALDVISMQITGPDAAQFVLKTSGQPSIQPKDSLAIVLGFCPTVFGCPMNATLHIVTNDVNEDIPLTGCSIQPSILATPTTIDFGLVSVNGCKDTTAEIKNNGTDTLIVSSQSIGDKVHISSLTSLPKKIAPGDSIVLNLRFCASDTNRVTTGDTLISDAPQSPSIFALTGKGKIGILSVPRIFDFGAIALDTCIDSGFYAHNIGSDTMTVGVYNLGSFSAGVFKTQPPNPPFILKPGDSTYLRFRICSSDTGSFAAFDSIYSDNSFTRYLGAIELRAHTAFGILGILRTVDFGKVIVGGCKDTTVIITNSGAEMLHVDSLPGLPPQFSVVSGLPVSINAGATSPITLRYCPSDSVATRYDSAFNVRRIAVTAPITLLGKGIQGALATSGPLDFGCVVVGTSPHKTILLRNTGSAALSNVGSSISGSPDFKIALQPTGTIPQGATDSTVVSVNFASYGNVSGTVSLTWTGAPSPITIPVKAHVSPAPRITVLDTVLKFDTVQVGDSSVSKCVRVTNYSCQPVSAHDITISSGSYEIDSSSTNLSLSDSSIATFCLRFKPKRNGLDTAEVTILSGPDTVRTLHLSGTGHSPLQNVDLKLDTVYAIPGQIIAMPVRILNDVSVAGITSVTFRVQFDPMQLDFKTPSQTGSVIAANTVSVHKYSLGDQEITVSGSQPFGGGVLIGLPFEVLQPTQSKAAVHLMSATFATAPAALGSTADGLINIQQCDTTQRIVATNKPLSVSQNSPNPFNPRTSVTLNATIGGHARITIMNMLGQQITVAYEGDLTAGEHVVELDGSTLPSGIYRYVTDWTSATGNSRDEKTMVVVK